MVVIRKIITPSPFYKGHELLRGFQAVFPSYLNRENIIFLCIGSDRATGDSLAPLIGSALKKQGYLVLGTVEAPITFQNIDEIIEVLPKGKTVIGIDAFLGDYNNKGLFIVEKGSMKIGIESHPHPREVADYHIGGIVTARDSTDLLHPIFCVSLNLVMQMANDIVKAIEQRFP